MGKAQGAHHPLVGLRLRLTRPTVTGGAKPGWQISLVARITPPRAPVDIPLSLAAAASRLRSCE